MGIFYKLKDKQEFSEYGGIYYRYRHRGSGATVVHLHNDDPENMFAFCFPTPPQDSTGLPHILEHTVLCGSKNFPLKDPFLQLLKGSVYSFLNAITFPDRTIYPAASPLSKDLFNLLRVYGDAVFFPLLQQEMFSQEGHHMFFTSQGDLDVGGVVYNEMIGASSTHDHVVSEWSYRGLLPDTIYNNSSGGEPEEILTLSYQKFIEYYKLYYRPSQALIFLYGNIPTRKYLQVLHRNFLGNLKFSKETRHKSAPQIVKTQPRWQAPKTLTKPFPFAGTPGGAAGKTDAKADTRNHGSVTLSWLLPKVGGTFDIVVAELVSELLLGHSGSPLYKALIDSPLGEDLSAASGMETELPEICFSVGLRGTAPENSQKIEELILQTLKGIVKTGFKQEQIDTAIFKLEFSLREIKALQGMRLLRRIIPGWMYANNPAKTLPVERSLSVLSVRLGQNPRLFEDYITTHLIDNPHRLTLIAEPDTNMAARNARALKQKLKKHQESLTPQEQKNISLDQEALRAFQGKREDKDLQALIPRLSASEMPRTARLINITAEQHNDMMLTSIRRHTNGVQYASMAFGLDALTNVETSYLPLFSTALTELGSKDLPADVLSERINRYFGGLHCNASYSADLQNTRNVRRNFLIHAKTLDSSTSNAVELLKEILCETDFSNKKRLKQLVTEEINEFRSSLIPNAHTYAAMSAVAALTPLGALSESLYGISQLQLLQSLPKSPTLLSQLASMAQKIFCRGVSIAALSSNGGGLESLQQLIMGLSDHVQSAVSWDGSPLSAEKLQPVSRSSIASYTIPAGGNYVALAIRATPFSASTIRHFSAEVLLAHILTTGPLWEEIRMRGGAYGAVARHASSQGAFCLTSYRDPHVARTLTKFMRILHSAPSLTITPESVEQAKVAITGKESRPYAPGEEIRVSLSRTINGYSDDIRQELHTNILNTTSADVSFAVDRLVASMEDRVISVIGEEKSIVRASEEFPFLRERLTPLSL